MKGIKRRAQFVKDDAVLISHHARIRMFERSISTDDLLSVVASGEIIEEYTDDEPCPSTLILGFINHISYHVVVGLCTDHLRIITVYIPEEEKWTDFKKRRT